SPSGLPPLLRRQTMSFRSKQNITKSNGFSLPPSRVLGHPHVELLEQSRLAGLAFGRENDSEPCPATDHPLVRLVHLFQREDFVHRPHSTEHAKRQRVL